MWCFSRAFWDRMHCVVMVTRLQVCIAGTSLQGQPRTSQYCDVNDIKKHNTPFSQSSSNKCHLLLWILEKMDLVRQVRALHAVRFDVYPWHLFLSLYSGVFLKERLIKVILGNVFFLIISWVFSNLSLWNQGVWERRNRKDCLLGPFTYTEN